MSKLIRGIGGGRPKGIPCPWKGKKLPWRKKKKKEKRRVFTWKQQKWADQYMQHGDQQRASIEAYGIDMSDPKRGRSYANLLAYKNRKNKEVVKYIQGAVSIATDTIMDLCEHAENEAVRLRAAQDVLDRAGFKPKEQLEIDDKRELNDEDMEAIRMVQSVLKGVKLEEIKPIEIKEAEIVQEYDDK